MDCKQRGETAPFNDHGFVSEANTRAAVKLELAWKKDYERRRPPHSHSSHASGSKNPQEFADKWFNDLCGAIHKAAKEVLPQRKTGKMPTRGISKHTKTLFLERARMRRSDSRRKYARIQRKIKKSCLADFNHWVEGCVFEIEAANAVGNSKRVYALVKKLSCKPRPPPVNLTSDSKGNILCSPEDTANVWYKFLKEKFEATKEEVKVRPPLKPLPTERTPADKLCREEFEIAIKKLKVGKARGPDDIPAEVFKQCPAIKEELFHFINFIWDAEYLPKDLALGKFMMLWKRKGSTNDPSTYRCICLLNHAYKVLAHILLARLLNELEGNLQDWQAGFRANRGCRDNSFILRTLCKEALELGRAISATFVDYKAAFDTLSHKFIDETLEEAEASPKLRAMFRAVYLAAFAFTTVPAPDGKSVASPLFPINRGVLQGDVTSPLYFIFALDLILRRHDEVKHKGVPLASTIVYTLGYADDIALIDTGDEDGISRASERVTSIKVMSKKDADMSVSLPKTKVLHVCAQGQVQQPTQKEAAVKCKFFCKYLNCNHGFLSKGGVAIHEGKCPWRHEHRLDKIVDHKGKVTSRKYLVKWAGHTDADNTWEPRSNVHPERIHQYEKRVGAYDHNWQHRCDVCGLACASARGVKIHKTKAHAAEAKQSFKGRLAEKAAKLDKLVEKQKERPQVVCDQPPLDNVFFVQVPGLAVFCGREPNYGHQGQNCRSYEKMWHSITRPQRPPPRNVYQATPVCRSCVLHPHLRV